MHKDQNLLDHSYLQKFYPNNLLLIFHVHSFLLATPILPSKTLQSILWMNTSPSSDQL